LKKNYLMCLKSIFYIL